MKLSNEIKLLTLEEAEALRCDKLPHSKVNDKGFYLNCENESYTAFDYSERQFWLEFIGQEGAPEGYEKEFSDPLSAVDWLHETKD